MVDDATKEKARQMCDEGIAIHKNATGAEDHEKSAAIQKEALALLGVKE